MLNEILVTYKILIDIIPAKKYISIRMHYKIGDSPQHCRDYKWSYGIKPRYPGVYS